MKQMRQFVLFAILLVFSWLILGINPVYAQDPTNSPTWSPLFPSTTPRPTLNDTCPDYQPLGWLTVTPSSKWLMNCSDCIIQPTADWSNIPYTPFPEEYVSHLGFCTETETAKGCYNDEVSGGVGCICLGYPTSTPALPTQQATPNMTATNTVNHLYKIPIGNFYLSANTYDFLPVSNIFGGYNMCGQDIFVGLYVNMNYTVSNLGHDYDQIALYKNENNLTFTGHDQNGWSRAWRQMYDQGSFDWERCYTSSYEGNDTVASLPGSGGNIHPCDVLYGSEVQHIGALVNLYGGNPNYSGFYVWAGYRNFLYVNGYAEAMCWGGNEPIPPQHTKTITPTLDTGSDYCNEVESATVESESIGITLPNPSVGQGSCIVVGGWEIDISWLAAIFPNLFTFNMPDSLGVPGFNLCLLPISFGTLNLFGLVIDMDIFFLIISYVMVVRWLLRS